MQEPNRKFANGNYPLISRSNNKVEDNISNLMRKRNGAKLAQLKTALSAVLARMDNLKLDFYMLVDIFRLEKIEADPLPPPFEIPELRDKSRKFMLGEYGSYFASFAILVFMTFATLELEWWINLLIIGFFFCVVTLVLPLLTELFNVSKENPASVTRAKIAACILTGCAVASVVLFAVYRSSAETEGIGVTLFNLSMPLAELFFALLGACCGEIKRFYNWSKIAEERHEQLEQEANRLEDEISIVSEKLGLEAPGPDNESIQEAPDTQN